ncbi:MAG: DinB family protein [Phycisphaeraceae bacterium]|nr:DinB family protein [Phycisphaeraceae bacterium]
MDNSTRDFVKKLWNEAFTQGVWAASWSKSIESLTGAQAAWQPPDAPSLHGRAGKRHSIWQNLLHMCLWREHWLRKLAGQSTPKEELETQNFPVITDTSEGAWAAARARFIESQKRIGAALTDSKTSDEQFEAIAHFLPHDCYHFGQINYLRAMQGLPPIE